MIYTKGLLKVTLLFESFRKKPIFGIYRPQVYIIDTKGYCTTLQLEVYKKEILQGEQVVIPGVLEAPVGFGKQLRLGALLTIKDGLDEIGKAIVLEINGYAKEPGSQEQAG